jgi:hypothetical protein
MQQQSPVTHLTAPEQQHMLLLFLPLKSAPSAQEEAAGTLKALFSGVDPRRLTGVHYFMVYLLPAGFKPPGVVPTFQQAPAGPSGQPKSLAVVLSIYDADFTPYITAFTDSPAFCETLDKTILANLDESGLGLDPDDPTTADNILANGGTFKNPQAFISLLMRYNFGDPTIPAATSFGNILPTPTAFPRYFLGATFPGLTIAKILDGYPASSDLWPLNAPKITYDPSLPPS